MARALRVFFIPKYHHWALDQALTASSGLRSFALEAGVSLALPVSLSLLQLTCPADRVRDAIGDDAALAALDMTPSPRRLLVWRAGRHAMLREVGVPAASFVEALLSGASPAAGLAAAIAQSPDAPTAIQYEIFSASFCRVISLKGETP